MTYLLPTNFSEPSPPTPFRYLIHGDAFSVRPEKRGNSMFWYLRKMVKGQTATIYLSPVGELTREVVDTAVEQVINQLQGEQ